MLRLRRAAGALHRNAASAALAISMVALVGSFTGAADAASSATGVALSVDAVSLAILRSATNAIDFDARAITAGAVNRATIAKARAAAVPT